MSILYHCYNKNGDKISVTGKELQELAKRGVITPETLIEVEGGKTIWAKGIKGLAFKGNDRQDEMETRIAEFLNEPVQSKPIPKATGAIGGISLAELQKQSAGEYQREQELEREIREERQRKAEADAIRRREAEANARLREAEARQREVEADAARRRVAEVKTAKRRTFCTNCGTHVAQWFGSVCRSCGAIWNGHRKYCQRCGVALNPEQVACVNCKAGVPEGGSTGGGSIFFLICGVLGGLWFFSIGNTLLGIILFVFAIGSFLNELVKSSKK